MQNKLFLTATGFLATLYAYNQPKKINKPNFVFILADDLGYGDIGCFGATDIKTPNIDQIAREGIKFTDFYCPSSVSSPSRAGLLTGRYPQRMGVNSVFFPTSLTGMPTNEITLPQILKKAGYSTGMVGKWHLGHLDRYLPLQRGFDEYFGIPYSNDMQSIVYLRGNEIENFNVDQQYITKTYTEESIKFIEKHKNQPFFLYIAHNMPHVPIYASEKFKGTSQRGLYGDVVQELDWSVGEIIKKLSELGLLENTIVFFTSDNGPWLAMKELGGSAFPLREGKQTAFEGGMRVPCVAMWKNKIPAGQISHDVILMLDIFPSFIKLAGGTIPNDRKIDGRDISPLLSGQKQSLPAEFLYLEYEQPVAYRYGDWKYKLAYKGNTAAWWKKAIPAHPELLINLKDDPGENINLAEKYPEKVIFMRAKLDSAYKSMGKLPPSIITQSDADNSHLEYLKTKTPNNE